MKKNKTENNIERLLTKENVKDTTQRLKEYDNSHPKMDELKFVQNIMTGYNISRKEAVKLIQVVRKVNKK